MIRIVRAAILHDGVIYSVPPPGRHHDVCDLLFALRLTQNANSEQGFVTSEGRFVRRKPAFLIAEAAGQIIKKTHPLDTLFSEDVW